MLRWTWFCGVMALTAAVTASAGDFPLEFKTIKAQDVMAFPGGYGTYGSLRLAEPSTLKKSPKAVSRHPLYGRLAEGITNATPFLFRLDESKGDGKGYDRLIVDLNQNGDLTDDPVIKPASVPANRKALPPGYERMLFGPIEAPPGKMIGKWRPIYFADMYLYNREAITNERIRDPYVGQMRMKAGWYLETTVALNGRKQKVGVVDGDANMRLGDLWKPSFYRNTGEDERWYFRPGDSVLKDTDGSGKFESDEFNTEACPFGPLVYLGPTPYKVALAADCKSIRIEPWTEPLADVEPQPRGDQVRELTLAWESSADQWQLIKPGVVNGKAKVPPGNYRLYQDVLAGKTGTPDQVMIAGSQSLVKKAGSIERGKANTLSCGAPLEIKVEAEKERPERAPVRASDRDAAADPKSFADFALRINARVVGAGGEIYSSFAKGKDLKADPPKPTVTVTDSEGKKLLSDNLEFG